jgi:hypothetical protein
MKARSSGLALLVVALTVSSADSIAQPAPSASASAGAKIVIPPWPDGSALPAFDAEPFPDEETKSPKPSEWSSATEVRLTRASRGTTDCHAFRLHEWIKIHCDKKTAGLRLLAGSTDGIALWVPDSLVSREAPPGEDPTRQAKREEEWLETMGRFGEIVFPVRRGDRRVFEWLGLNAEWGYDGGLWIGSSSRMIVEEQWLEGAKKPRIALLTR